MKKTVKLIFIVTFATFLLLSLYGCTDNKSNSATYTATTTENNSSVTYSLTLDYNNDTFLMTKHSSAEIKYIGSFTSINGYYKLSSSDYGIQYIKLNGDNFEFFTPENNDTPSSTQCVHVWKKTASDDGDCSHESYTSYVCEKCNLTRTEFGKKGDHNYVLTEKIEGTCKTYGYTIYTCSVCHTTKKVYDKELAAHKLSGNEVIIDNGCLEKCISQQSCTVCHEVIKTELDYYGSHNYTNGVCSVCHYCENGFSSNHLDENSDGLCDACGKNKIMLDSVSTNGYYVYGNAVYYGAYPQTISKYSAETIKNNGIYDKETGYYRYNNESYAIFTTNNYVSSVTFSDGKKIDKNTSYAFIVEPILWHILNTNDNNYTIVSSVILDKQSYLSGINITKINDIFYNTYGGNTVDNGILANNFLESELIYFLNNQFFYKSFTSVQSALKEENTKIIIPSKDNITSYNVSPPKISDYALAKNISAIKKTNTDFNIGYIYTSSPDDEKSNYIYCLKPSGSLESVIISSEYGFLPMMTIVIE